MKFLFSCVLIFLFHTAAAQGFNPYFSKILVENGLSHKKVNCILQDKRGFMWFGTEDGLTMYDGTHFTIFRSEPNVTTCLSGNIVTDLYEDKSGMLWIATSDGGITKYDYRQSPLRKFRQFKHDKNNPKSIPENGIAKIIEDNLGNLWLASAATYAIRFNKKTEKFDHPVNEGAKCYMTFAKGDRDNLWAGRAGGGLIKINTKSLKHEEDLRYNDFYIHMPHAAISSIYKDKSGTFWLGNWDSRVYRYTDSNKMKIGARPEAAPAGVPNDEMLSFAEDNNNRIWMAGKKTGVTVYNRTTHEVTNFRHNPLQEGSITNDHVNVVYIDRGGIVWIGTDDGLNKFNALFSSFVKHLLPKNNSTTSIYDFYKDAEDKLWIATSEGIFVKNQDRETLEYRKVVYKGEKLAVTKFFMDKDNTFYIGTDYTLFIYDLKTNKVTPLPHTDDDPVMKRIISSRIVSIVRDTINDHPALIVSPYGHYIAYYDLVDKRWVSRSDSAKNIVEKYDIRDNLVRKLYADQTGDLWLANYKFGLGSWQGNCTAPMKYYVSDFKNKLSLSNDDIFDILEIKKGYFWISTYGGGLNYFDKHKNQFTHIKSSTNITEGIQSDYQGNLWMLCNGHVHKYDIANANYSCYNLPDLQHSEGLRGYIYKDEQNLLYAAGTNYFVTFYPGEIQEIISEPKVYLTDFKIFNESFSHWINKKTIVLDYYQNFFSIEFSAPEFTGENVVYSYMLEGADKKWIHAGKRNFAIYSNLPGGKYHFKVKASNWEDNDSTHYESIDIIITPPFWLRAWFFALIFIVICTIAYLFYRNRVNTLLAQQAIRNGIAQDLHDQIGSTLGSISVYGEVAKIYHGRGESGQLDGVLDTISETANDMIGDMSDIVWAINPKNDNLLSVISRIKNFAGPLCKVKGIEFTFKHPSKNLGNIATTEVRKNLYLILKETINNAIKHADCKHINVELKVVDNYIHIQIKDDGKGFDTTGPCTDLNGSLSGNGLGNIRFRAEEIKAGLSINSGSGNGTTVRLSLRMK